MQIRLAILGGTDIDLNPRIALPDGLLDRAEAVLRAGLVDDSAAMGDEMKSCRRGG
jgi:hypothetical protein